MRQAVTVMRKVDFIFLLPRRGIRTFAGMTAVTMRTAANRLALRRLPLELSGGIYMGCFGIPIRLTRKHRAPAKPVRRQRTRRHRLRRRLLAGTLWRDNRASVARTLARARHDNAMAQRGCSPRPTPTKTTSLLPVRSAENAISFLSGARQLHSACTTYPTAKALRNTPV